jgi:WD40 repeat protein
MAPPATASHDKTVKVWDARTGQEVLSSRPTPATQQRCIQPRRHASCQYQPRQDREVWTHRQEVFSFKADTASGLMYSFSPDGTRLAASGFKPRYGTSEGQTIQTSPPGSVGAVAFSPDGTRLAGACLTGR